MSDRPQFLSAHPYQDNVLALPVLDIDTAAKWYANGFRMTEVDRMAEPQPTVILERDNVRIGFAVNGGDASQDGAAILVSDIKAMREALQASGVQVGDLRVDERDGKKFEVFFVVAPDGLCYYFHQEI